MVWVGCGTQNGDLSSGEIFRKHLMFNHMFNIKMKHFYVSNITVTFFMFSVLILPCFITFFFYFSEFKRMYKHMNIEQKIQTIAN